MGKESQAVLYWGYKDTTCALLYPTPRAALGAAALSALRRESDLLGQEATVRGRDGLSQFIACHP